MTAIEYDQLTAIAEREGNENRMTPLRAEALRCILQAIAEMLGVTVTVTGEAQQAETGGPGLTHTWDGRGAMQDEIADRARIIAENLSCNKDRDDMEYLTTFDIQGLTQLDRQARETYDHECSSTEERFTCAVRNQIDDLLAIP